MSLNSLISSGKVMSSDDANVLAVSLGERKVKKLGCVELHYGSLENENYLIIIGSGGDSFMMKEAF